MATIKHLKSSDLISAYIAFFDKNGGKQRPALVLQIDDNSTLEVLTITSQYEVKSKKIKEQYYPLKDWQEEGLKKQSYVDIRSLTKIYLPFQKHLYKIGEITIADQKALTAFLVEYHCKHS